MKGSMYKSTKHSIKEDRRLRDRPAKFITPGQAGGDGNTNQTEVNNQMRMHMSRKELSFKLTHKLTQCLCPATEIAMSGSVIDTRTGLEAPQVMK